MPDFPAMQDLDRLDASGLRSVLRSVETTAAIYSAQLDGLNDLLDRLELSVALGSPDAARDFVRIRGEHDAIRIVFDCVLGVQRRIRAKLVRLEPNSATSPSGRSAEQSR